MNPKSVPKEPPVNYIAINDPCYTNKAYSGSLSKILSEMESDEEDPNDYTFHRAVEVKVRFEKKLVLVEDTK